MVNKISEKEFNEKINVEKKVIVDCYADWCGPCRMLAPIIDEVASTLTDYDFYKLNVDDAMEVSKQYGIMSIPTLIKFKGGEEVKKVIGYRSKEELLEDFK